MMMVEQYSVPEGPIYTANSFGPGFSSYRSDFIKTEDKMGELLPAYQADTPPGKYRASSDWSSSYLELGGCWFDDLNCPMDESIVSMTQSNMYDFDNILTPDMTPPHHDFGQSDCMDDIRGVLSSLSSHSSLSELPFSADNLDALLPTCSPTLPDMSVVSPPLVIHPHAKDSSPLATPPATSTPHKPEPEEESSSPSARSASDVTSASTKRKSSTASAPKRRRLTEPRRQRKREQNKAAALKYRSRKKEEKLSLDKQQAILELENAELLDEVKHAEEEIAYLKSMLHEVCMPSNTSASNVVQP